MQSEGEREAREEGWGALTGFLYRAKKSSLLEECQNRLSTSPAKGVVKPAEPP